MTNKIYEKESYRKEIDTEIIECHEYNGKKYVVLKDTIFMVNLGGQNGDQGFIYTKEGQYEVLNGIKKDNELWIQVDRLPAVGKCHCEINWQNRHDRMQQHTGEHIVSGIVKVKYGFENIGFHLSDNSPVTLVMGGKLSTQQVREIEKQANEIIYKNYSVTDSYPTDEELKEIDYRSKIEIKEQVRIITIGDNEITIDTCACCAPHLHSTAEVGIIKLLWAVPYKGGTQIGMLAGRRALDYINSGLDIVDTIAVNFSTSRDKIIDKIKSMEQEILYLQNSLQIMWNEKLQNMANIMKEEGRKGGCLFVTDETPQASMKYGYNILCSIFDGYVGIFKGNDGDYTYFAGNTKLDSNILGKEMRERLQAKGGGKSDMQQGKISCVKEEIEKLFEELNRDLDMPGDHGFANQN